MSGSLRKRPRSYAAARPTSLGQPRRRQAQLTRGQTLWTRGPGPARTRPPLLRHRVPPLQPLQMTTSGRRYPAQRLSPRPGTGRPLLSGSRASAPRAPLTKQAIRTSRYLGAIFSLTARCTFDRYEGRCYTDNQSNEALLRKAMTTKFPSTLVLMELAEELSAKNCELQLQWIRRDLNQLADDLTNENFASFDPNFRVDLKGEALEWRVLGRLLAHATSYFEELGSAKRTKKAPATRFAKRPRKLGPW